METGTGGSLRARRASGGRFFVPYNRQGSAEGQTLPRDGSFSTISPTPSTLPVSVTSDPPPQPTSVSLGAGNPPANGVVHPAYSRRLIQLEEYAPPRTHRGEFTPEDPIHFSVNGTLGISISHAADGIHASLDGRDDRMVVFKNSSVLFRMQFYGHDPYTSKVNAHDNTAEWNPIPRCKLAREIGKRVKQYLENKGFSLDAADRIYLTRFVHVSKGSWQPELLYDDLVVTPNSTA